MIRCIGANEKHNARCCDDHSDWFEFWEESVLSRLADQLFEFPSDI